VKYFCITPKMNYSMDISEFDYDFDEELIAQRPAEPRDSSRLMYVGKDSIKNLHFRDITNILEEGDVIVKNKTKVMPARIRGTKPTGGKIEVLLYNREDDNIWKGLVKGSNIKEGMKLEMGKVDMEVIEHLNGGRYLLRCPDAKKLMQEEGVMPTPPYIKEPLVKSDDYQTVYAEEPGSVAAPTAGFHFTEEVINELRAKGVEIHDITLHVGPGTFLPVRTQEVEKHDMEKEYFMVEPGTAEAITTANEEGRRLILVGTTTVRALESISNNGRVKAGQGWTDLFIYPGYEFQSGMDIFLTNFHLPRSTPLLLVFAFGGKERLMRSYKMAVDKRYRFYSFGDAMMLEGKND